MEKNWPKILQVVLYGVFALAFVLVTLLLFWNEVVTGLWSGDKEKNNASTNLEQELRVILPEEILTLEPTVIAPAVRQRLVNIYEPLVRPDRDLKMRPSLALSWGVIDDYTWEFRLRPDVKFQDGSDFDAEDVVASVERAKDWAGSELVAFLDTIEKVQIIDSLTVRVVTKEPDPLLLQRMAMVLIVPKELAQQEMAIPMGTGPYKFVSWKQNENLVMERFSEYWNGLPHFKVAEILTIADKVKRVKTFAAGKADLLAFIPYDAVSFVLEKGFKVAAVPSLEVQFLAFNVNSELMKETGNREVISLAIDQDALVEAVGGFARKSNQFVSSGVFGFNTDLDQHEYDLEKAEILARRDLKDKTVKIHLPQNLNVLGEHLRKQFTEIGLKPVVSYLEFAELLKSIEAGRADIYFLGFKSDLGDSSGFFEDIVMTGASYNVGGYSNTDLDVKIVESSAEMDAEKRLQILQEAMNVVVKKDVFGVPLFEYETVYGFGENLNFEPRIDGLIYFDEITKN